MLTAPQLRGIFPALLTPVHADDTLHVDAAHTLIDYVLRQGVDGLVPLGGTGEYGALPRAERIRMCRLTADRAAGRVPVIPGVLDPGLYDALQAGREFADAGADALMVLTPYYTTPTQEGIRDYFLRYADAAPLPVMIYEIPYRTRVAIAPEILHELSRHDNIIGMKACNTDMYHFLRTVAGVDASFAVFSGEDSLLPLHLAAGARGGIVVTANVLPTAWRKIYTLAQAGSIRESIDLHRRLIPLMNMAFAETNPGPLKSVMDLIGVDACASRNKTCKRICAPRSHLCCGSLKGSMQSTERHASGEPTFRVQSVCAA